MKNLISLQPAVLEVPCPQGYVRAALHITSHHWPVCWPGGLGCWWVREWGQSEELGPEQCSGVSVRPLSVLGGSLHLSHCSLGGSIALLHPGWSPFNEWCYLHLPAFLGSQNLLSECSCCRAGAWAKSRGKLGKTSILLSFAEYQRADSGALISLVATAVVSPLGCPETRIPSGMHSFICVPGRMLVEWAS